MKEAEQKLTLDGPISYQIKVPGELDAKWSDWAAGMTLAVFDLVGKFISSLPSE